MNDINRQRPGIPLLSHFYLEILEFEHSPLTRQMSSDVAHDKPNALAVFVQMTLKVSIKLFNCSIASILCVEIGENW